MGVGVLSVGPGEVGVCDCRVCAERPGRVDWRRVSAPGQTAECSGEGTNGSCLLILFSLLSDRAQARGHFQPGPITVAMATCHLLERPGQARSHGERPQSPPPPASASVCSRFYLHLIDSPLR